MSTPLHTPTVHERPDEWHHHTREEGIPQHEHAAVIDVRALFVWFIAICAFVVGFIVVTVMFFNSYHSRMRYQIVETTASSRAFNAVKANAQRDLGMDADQPGAAWGWVDHERVRVPVSLAMERVVEKYKAR